MENHGTEEVTELLRAWSNGDRDAEGRLMDAVYGELRKLARAYLNREFQNNSLQPTLLVNEVYLRLVDQPGVEWQGRKHFFGIAARLMRQVLVDHARGRKAEKRGGNDLVLVPLNEAVRVVERCGVDILRLDDLLDSLEKLNPRLRKLLELRVFVGSTIEEAAEILDISPATVGRDWTFLKMWLNREMSSDGSE